MMVPIPCLFDARPIMRKRTINAAQPDLLQTCEWLNIEEIAQVEVSSEDPQYPIESAFNICSEWEFKNLSPSSVNISTRSVCCPN